MIYIGNKEPTPYVGDKAIEYIYIGDKLYYSAINAHTVTYYVDTDIVYNEDVNKGDSCLSPTSFTPSKSGYVFVGWREDNIANSSVLSDKIMDNSEISLYAVFSKTITCTLYNGGEAAMTDEQNQYYNNGNILNPSFMLTQISKYGWTPLGWCASNSATAAVVVNNNDTITLSADATYYGKYRKMIGVYYDSVNTGGTAPGSEVKYGYFNSGNYSYPSFTIKENTWINENKTFRFWQVMTSEDPNYSKGRWFYPNDTIESLTGSIVLQAYWT